MKTTIKTGLAALVLLHAFSRKKEITTIQAPVNTDEMARQAFLADGLGICLFFAEITLLVSVLIVLFYFKSFFLPN